MPCPGCNGCDGGGIDLAAALQNIDRTCVSYSDIAASCAATAEKILKSCPVDSFDKLDVTDPATIAKMCANQTCNAALKTVAGNKTCAGLPGPSTLLPRPDSSER